MITIYGYSDDLVEVSGCKGADEFNTNNFEADLAPAGEGGQMTVYCRYERSGCWSVGIGLVDEDVPFPNWALSIRQGRREDEAVYTAVLEIDAPEGTRLVNVREA
jgi:hypothetical protein